MVPATALPALVVSVKWMEPACTGSENVAVIFGPLTETFAAPGAGVLPVTMGGDDVEPRNTH